MGVPTKISKGPTSAFSINALPMRAYAMIWQEWFRDQNVDNPAVNSNEDATVNYTDDETKGMDADKPNLEYILQYAYTGGRPLPVNKYHDYFTSALPSPQKAGEPVKVPINGDAGIYLYPIKNPINKYENSGTGQDLQKIHYLNDETDPEKQPGVTAMTGNILDGEIS